MMLPTINGQVAALDTTDSTRLSLMSRREAKSIRLKASSHSLDYSFPSLCIKIDYCNDMNRFPSEKKWAFPLPVGGREDAICGFGLRIAPAAILFFVA
jgi:hypothetical protein